MASTTRPEPRISTLTPDHAGALMELDRWAFPFGDETALNPEIACLEWDRTRAAHLPGSEDLAGVNSVYSLELPVPGGALDCAGLTWVSVHPLHRRRGILTAMIRDHLALARERGEPVSALHASEATIYGRFGYGVAARHLYATVPRGAALRDVPGAGAVRLRLEKADAERHADLVGDCYDAARRLRPGMVSRRSPGLRRLRLADPPSARNGGESLRILIAEADSESGPARGYALFRRKGVWSGIGPDGTVIVRELVARDPAAARALWGRLLDLDLMARVELDPRPVDDALFQLMLDPRAAAPVLADGLWIRLVDLPRALAGRRYSTALDVVIEVSDELCPANAGRWRLTGGPDGAECTPCPDPAAFHLDVRELGAAYLGSITLDSLAAAGLITVLDPAAFATASAAFAWPVAPWCSWGF
jgi:predicted acetyltransferase